MKARAENCYSGVTKADKRGGYWSTMARGTGEVIYLGFGLTREKAETAAMNLIPPTPRKTAAQG